jgi:hypothetical protein
MCNEHGTSESVVSGGVDELEGFVELVIIVDIGLVKCEPRTTLKKGELRLTVMTGPKISSRIVTDLGSLVRITVGLT